MGSGLYDALAFVLFTVPITGLVVGRTSGYLGKKIESFDIKTVCLIALALPLLALLGTATAVISSDTVSWLTGLGAYGFSKILYVFSSMMDSSGSAFVGFHTDTVLTSVSSGVVMLLVRFVSMAAVIFLAGNTA